MSSNAPWNPKRHRGGNAVLQKAMQFNNIIENNIKTDEAEIVFKKIPQKQLISKQKTKQQSKHKSKLISKSYSNLKPKPPSYPPPAINQQQQQQQQVQPQPTKTLFKREIDTTAASISPSLPKNGSYDPDLIKYGLLGMTKPVSKPTVVTHEPTKPISNTALTVPSNNDNNDNNGISDDHDSDEISIVSSVAPSFLNHSETIQPKPKTQPDIQLQPKIEAVPKTVVATSNIQSNNSTKPFASVKTPIAIAPAPTVTTQPAPTGAISTATKSNVNVITKQVPTAKNPTSAAPQNHDQIVSNNRASVESALSIELTSSTELKQFLKSKTKNVYLESESLRNSLINQVNQNNKGNKSIKKSKKMAKMALSDSDSSSESDDSTSETTSSDEESFYKESLKKKKSSKKASNETKNSKSKNSKTEKNLKFELKNIDKKPRKLATSTTNNDNNNSNNSWFAYIGNMVGLSNEPIDKQELTEIALQDMFKQVDVNNSGLLDLDEFKKAIKLLGYSNEIDAKREFYRVDEDNSGFLDYEEFRRAMLGRAAKEISLWKLKKIFKKLDKNKNKTMEFDEFKSAAKYLQFGTVGGEDDLKQCFDKVDTNKSGLVEWKEFVTAILMKPCDYELSDYSSSEDDGDDDDDDTDYKEKNNKSKHKTSPKGNGFIVKCKQIWKKIDEDNNGYLDYSEFVKAGKLLLGSEKGIKVNEIKKAFIMADVNDNGKIEFSEFVKYMEKLNEE